MKGATEGRKSDIRDQLKQVLPRDYVYIRVFKRGWTEPRHEGPSKVVLANPTAVKVEGRKVWVHLNHCSRATLPRAWTKWNFQTKNKSPNPLRDTTSIIGR